MSQGWPLAPFLPGTSRVGCECALRLWSMFYALSLLSLGRETRSYRLYWETRLLSFIFTGRLPKCNPTSKGSPFTNTRWEPTQPPLKPIDENHFSFMATKRLHMHCFHCELNLLHIWGSHTGKLTVFSAFCWQNGTRNFQDFDCQVRTVQTPRRAVCRISTVLLSLCWWCYIEVDLSS